MEKTELLQLILNCKSGDETAYETLYRKFYPFVFRYALSLTHCDADAHDVAQLTMITVHEQIKTLKMPEYFTLWIKRICFNQCTRLFRKNKHVVFNDSVMDALQDRSDQSFEGNPIKAMRFHSDRDVMTYFLGLLSKGQRDVMELFYFQQCTSKEIADKLNIPEGTVKSRIHTAKQELKRKIKQYEQEEAIALDFNSDVLFGYLGGSALIGTFTQLASKSKSFLTSSAIKTSMYAVLTGAIGIGGYALYDQIQNQQSRKALKQNVSQSAQKSLPQKTFQTTKVLDQEISTAQDAYFKIITWANNDADIQASTREECLELENLLNSLKEYGGFYYEELEKSDFIEKFYKNANLDERLND